MADNRVFGNIEYGFKEALHKLADAMKDASAIVGKWKEICTSSKPTVTLEMGGGEYEVMTLAGIKESLGDWANQTSGLLVRSRFQAENGIRKSTYGYKGAVYQGAYLPTGINGARGEPFYKVSNAYNSSGDVYCLSSESTIDYFIDILHIPRYIGFTSAIASESQSQVIHSIGIRPITEVNQFPIYDVRKTAPFQLGTDFFISNLSNTGITIKFYTGTSYDQFITQVDVPAGKAKHLMCLETIKGDMRIQEVRGA